jgi:hypothetical protein
MAPIADAAGAAGAAGAADNAVSIGGAPDATQPDGEATQIRALISEVDTAAHDDEWDEVVSIRDRCLRAVERGHQWWPAAAWAEYRMGLDGPPNVAASVIGSTLERFTLGPFAEVVAGSNSWSSVVDHLDSTPAVAVFAQECVMRGDDLRADEVAQSLPQVFDLPLARMPWEPDCGQVRYSLDAVTHDPPSLPQPVPLTAAAIDRAAQRLADEGLESLMVDDDATEAALRSIVAPWITAGLTVSVGVVGADPETMLALRAHSYPGVIEIDAATALQWIGWAAASGGPAGERRRGLAAARSQLWWLLSSLLQCDEPDQQAEVIATELDTLRWYRFTDDVRAALPGWQIGLAIWSEQEGLTWVLTADAPAGEQPQSPPALQ